MARHRGQKALYEVMGRSQSKPKSRGNRLVERLQAREHKEQAAEPKGPATGSAHNDQIRWDPRPIQFNAGRVELVLPYPLVFALVLAMLIVILAAFKFGQYTRPDNGTRQRPDPGAKNTRTGGKSKTPGAGENPTVGRSAEAPSMEPTRFDAKVRPGNAIVIQQHRVLADLVPVKRFFADRGIATEIIRTANTFFLVTKQRFAGAPDKEGSPGYLLEQQIHKLGTDYQAPPDRARFVGFGDAYGKYFSEQFQGEVVNVD